MHFWQEALPAAWARVLDKSHVKHQEFEHSGCFNLVLSGEAEVTFLTQKRILGILIEAKGLGAGIQRQWLDVNIL